MSDMHIKLHVFFSFSSFFVIAYILTLHYVYTLLHSIAVDLLCQGGGGSLMTAGPNYPSMRSAAGPSSSSSSGTMNNVNNSLMAELMASANSLNNGASLPCGMAGSSCGTAGLTSSSLFNVLQQEVAEETRLAALNAMTQRLMTSLEGTRI